MSLGRGGGEGKGKGEEGLTFGVQRRIADVGGGVMRPEGSR